jgi:Protein of unknown function (DUF3318)
MMESNTNANRLSADPEFRRLLDLVPASARMTAKLRHQPNQKTILNYQRPWFANQDRTISINLRLWAELPMPQRDLLLLYVVNWQNQSQWLKPDLYQGIAAVGAIAGCIEGVQQDAVGVVAALGLSAIATVQVWRQSQGVRLDLAADREALAIAQQRGYSETDAASHLLKGIASSAELEGRNGLAFNELIRSQQLRTIAGLSQVRVPESDTP